MDYAIPRRMSDITTRANNVKSASSGIEIDMLTDFCKLLFVLKIINLSVTRLHGVNKPNILQVFNVTKSEN